MIDRTQWLASLAKSATPSIDECIEVLGGSIDLLYSLKDTEQDSLWHAEGNVYIHTGMVLDELYQILSNEASHILGLQRQALVLAALLHDIAKPIRTRAYEVDGMQRIGAPMHAYYGASYLAFKLPGLELEFETIWSILTLVAEHHTPKILVVKNKPKSEYLLHSRQVSTELVYWLELADVRGRKCPDPDYQLQCLEEYRMFAEEYDIWGVESDIRSSLLPSLENLSSRAQNYIYGHAVKQLETGKITQAEEAIATTYEYRDKHSRLVILCGPSASGKSTFISKNYPAFTTISLDELREKFNHDRGSQKNKGKIIQYAKEQLREELRNKRDVIWDATNLRQDFRSIISTIGQNYHALVTLVVFIVPEATLFQNNKAREHSVPMAVLQTQIERYQMPMLFEAHQLCVVDKSGSVVYESGCIFHRVQSKHRICVTVQQCYGNQLHSKHNRENLRISLQW